MEENKPEVVRYREMLCEVFIANASVKRVEGENYVMFWKRRRNGQIATKRRVKYGPGATLVLDTKTMSVETERARHYREFREKRGPRKTLKEMVNR